MQAFAAMAEGASSALQVPHIDGGLFDGATALDRRDGDAAAAG